jgi:hypothetical protein
MSGIEDFYKGEAKSFIELCTGDLFYPGNPTFNIVAIANALAKNCRFNGHSGIMYTVGQHSLMVAEIMRRMRVDLGDPEIGPLEGLMHDATEAYLTDVPAPFKQFLPDFKQVDGAWEKALRHDYMLPVSKSKACAEADWIALFIEADVFMPSHGTIFVDPAGYREHALTEYRDLRMWIHERPWREVAQSFITAYDYFRPARATYDVPQR